MRDYIFSLTLLTIFLGGYTALVIGFARPESKTAKTAQATDERGPATQTVAEPNSED